MVRCVLFYPGGPADETAEAVLDREIAAGSLELLGVSAPPGATIPERRRALPYLPPESVTAASPDYVLLLDPARTGRRGSGAKDRIKRLLPGFLLDLGRSVGMAVLTRRNMRRWKSYPGWGKPIARRPELVFPETSPLGEWGIPLSLILPGRVLTIPGFRMEEYDRLRRQGISFLSDNCWGGLMYHTLGLEMLSPFINMFIRREQFMTILSDLPRYLKEPLVPSRPRRNSTAASVYPVMLLGDQEIHFNHVTSPEELEEFAEKWYRRRDRILQDRIFVETCFPDREDFEMFREEFASWPWPKIGYTPFPAEGEGIVYLSAYEKNKNRYESFAEFTRSCAKNDIPGGVPYDFLSTYLTGAVQPPRQEDAHLNATEEPIHAIS